MVEKFKKIEIMSGGEDKETTREKIEKIDREVAYLANLSEHHRNRGDKEAARECEEKIKELRLDKDNYLEFLQRQAENRQLEQE